MSMRTLLFLTFGLVHMTACAKKEKALNATYIPPATLSADAVPGISRVPTNPEGGLVPGKLQPMDPEESARRKARNEIMPILFGVGAAGITMQSSQDEVKAMLSGKLGSASGFDYYPEHLRIAWDRAEDPRPAFMIVDSGYAGQLELPAPYGDVRVGQSLASLITSDADLLSFMRAAGASFEKASSPDYRCDVSLTCRLLVNVDSFELQFKLGGIVLSRDGNLKINLIYFLPSQNFYPRVSDPIIYGQSIGGVSFMSMRKPFEDKYGPPEQLDSGISYYDQGSLGVTWGLDNVAVYVGALRTFQGSMNFGGTIGQHKIGDALGAFVAPTDDGKELMLLLDRTLENRAANFDCSAQVTPLCDLQKVGNFIVIKLSKATFVFTADATKRWLLIEMAKE